MEKCQNTAQRFTSRIEGRKFIVFDPSKRSLYTSALTPPPGMVFDEAIATTFSLDPLTLLTIPTYLTLLSHGRDNPLEDPIVVLESLRRISSKITIYCQRGRINIPKANNVLYGLLESMIVEVNAPRGGVFHPKLWLIKYISPESPEKSVVRFLVLSRNLTSDRSWDLSLQLEGTPKGRLRSENKVMGEFIDKLPSLSLSNVPKDIVRQAKRLSGLFRKTKWEMPYGVEELDFTVLGFDNNKWVPPDSKRMAIISPFCKESALDYLTDHTDCPEVLISRPETFEELGESIEYFENCMVLDEAAEIEDGENTEDGIYDTLGLHAKAYICENGWNTNITIGSANATNAAILKNNNVEVLVSLSGKKSRIGGIDDLIGSDGFGEVLIDYKTSNEQNEPDADKKAAEKALEDARELISNAKLELSCTINEQKHTWNLLLKGGIVSLANVKEIKAWPITVSKDHSTDLIKHFNNGEAMLGAFSPASITSLIAFELKSTFKDVKLSFVLNLPLINLPEERDIEITRLLVKNREGFLKYLLLLLGETWTLPIKSENLGNPNDFTKWGNGFNTNFPILEELVRAFSRNPEKLIEVNKVVKRLTKSDDESIVPYEFVNLWSVFESAME